MCGLPAIIAAFTANNDTRDFAKVQGIVHHGGVTRGMIANRGQRSEFGRTSHLSVAGKLTVHQRYLAKWYSSSTLNCR